MNKRSGWKAITGTTNFAEIAVENPPTENHRLAFDIVVDRIVGFVGSYFVKLQGQVDALVFAGGIGEHSALLRRAVTTQCGCLGFTLDEQKNATGLGDGDATIVDITGSDRTPRVLICQTNEQVCSLPRVGSNQLGNG